MGNASRTTDLLTSNRAMNAVSDPRAVPTRPVGDHFVLDPAGDLGGMGGIGSRRVRPEPALASSTMDTGGGR
jgi:hypothetical protein